jgi:hypothetical protein
MPGGAGRPPKLFRDPSLPQRPQGTAAPKRAENALKIPSFGKRGAFLGFSSVPGSQKLGFPAIFLPWPYPGKGLPKITQESAALWVSDQRRTSPGGTIAPCALRVVACPGHEKTPRRRAQEDGSLDGGGRTMEPERQGE